MGWIIALVVFIVLASFIIATYNNLIQSRNKVKNSFAQIDTQLQRRFDLIPNLVETVKGFATHEKSLLENVTASRSGYMNAHTTNEKMEADNQLTSTLKTLFSVVENYPELKANENFMQLQNDLNEIEEKITFARQFYNDTVTLYNNKLQVFPSNIVAGIFGFKEEDLFSTSDTAKVAPKVQF